MAGFAKFAAFALAASVSASAFGLVTITETFDNDPTPRGWSGVHNMEGTPPFHTDYGFKIGSDETGSAVNPPWGSATGAGEAGGRLNRGPNSFYGVDLGGPIDFATNDMSVQGVLRLPVARGSAAVDLGWSQGIDSLDNSSDDNPINCLYIGWEDGIDGGLEARAVGGIDGTDGPDLVDNGPARPFTMSWVASTGTFTVDIGGDSASLVLGADKADLAQMTHWGMWGRTASGPDDAANFFFIDDIRFTAVPEPAALGLLGLGSLVALRRRMA